jgi:hypothetical protein
VEYKGFNYEVNLESKKWVYEIAEPKIIQNKPPFICMDKFFNTLEIAEAVCKKHIDILAASKIINDEVKQFLAAKEQELKNIKAPLIQDIENIMNQ